MLQLLVEWTPKKGFLVIYFSFLTIGYCRVGAFSGKLCLLFYAREGFGSFRSLRNESEFKAGVLSPVWRGFKSRLGMLGAAHGMILKSLPSQYFCY